MSKKISLKDRAMHWFTYHPWLKLIALILAVMVWFYIREELNRFNY
ncbi:MAG: hypothetical protein KJ880_01805 [Candidatus Omnitrophica bacterium]|nr:hypothetical protein [Candidatus Omnitrophota bacterium]MBU1869535.1 hypothetical protein [Candidatus Omnitrophota bacterium]